MAKKKLSSDMIAFMRELILQEKTKVAQDPDIKSRPGTQPKKYHKGLSKSTKAARDAHFKKNNDYGPAPGDKGAKTKKSKHTKKFEKMFGESINEMPAGRSEKDTGKFNDLPKALRDKMIARYGEPKFDGKHDFISNDGDTLFQAYEKNDETGSVAHKIIKLPSFQKLYSDWSDIIKDIKTLRKNPDVNQDAKARELFEEMKSMFRSLQRYLREERPEQYELMKMRRSMNEMANEEVINQKLSKLDYKFLNSYFDAEKFSAPNPDDSLRQINNERDWDQWKAGTLEKYGDVDVELNKDEAWFSKFKIIDTEFMKDKKSYTDAKGRALDSWRKTSNYGLDERLEKIAKKILKEKLDYNDPIMIKLRQAQMKKAQMDKEEAELKIKKAALDKKYGSSYMDKLDAEISLKQELQDLKDERAQLMRDMEQEAEPEGGEIADKYGSRLNDIDAKTAEIKKELEDLRAVHFENINEEMDGGRLFDYFKSKGYDVKGRSADGNNAGFEGYQVTRGSSRSPQSVIFQYNKDTDEFTISRMSGYRIDQDTAIKAGMRQAGRSGVAGMDSYMTDGNWTPVNINAEDLKDIVDHVMSGLDREGQAQSDFYKDRGRTSGTVDETLISEFLGGNLEKRNQVLFDKLVPGQGDSEFVEGEMIRAMNRLVYRWYNDGDKFWEGYGTETAGPAHSFLVNSPEIPSEERRRFEKLFDAVVGKYGDEVYEKMLNDLAEAVLTYVEGIPEDQYQKLEQGMFNYEPEYEEEEEDEDDYDDYYDDEEDDDYYQEGVNERKNEFAPGGKYWLPDDGYMAAKLRAEDGYFNPRSGTDASGETAEDDAEFAIKNNMKVKDPEKIKKFIDGWMKYNQEVLDGTTKLVVREPDPNRFFDKKRRSNPGKHNRYDKKTNALIQKLKAKRGVNEGKEDEALKNKAEKANAPLSALRAIYNKGLAAFKSGHRPGANQHQWAMARVNSVLTGGPARKTDDAQWKQIQKFRKNKKKK